ncbi:RapZ C-terminal domain-containing protein [Aridibaculum aurantiacum]|uniref:RapZ C-terminal domain-containing protein n=1 Tax=Aridibaculum aurantiacum TaxID=2810307 RepID=UPI001A974D19|nr:RNase adapter RapZ [Aridibaculum aurantiacum]
MEKIIAAVSQLFEQYKKQPAGKIEKLPQSGSDRVYFRIFSDSGESYIATYNQNIKENETFLSFTDHFRKAGLPMPQVLIVNDDKTIYLQQDLGSHSLLDVLEREGHNEHTYKLFEKSLRTLAHIQIEGHEGFNYDWCLTAKEFGKQAIMSDLLYFKYYFLDTLKLPYDKQALLDDFDALASYLTNNKYNYFMYRDFQSRNIMVKNDEVCFIDYQGGMKGALQYDVASMLWQAKANLSEEWKNKLLDDYIDEVEKLLGEEIDREEFISQYNGYVLIRLLQVLGAYGFRGLFERKAHFLTSIPLALRNLQFFLLNKKVDINIEACWQILQEIVQPAVIERFEVVRATEETPLVVNICSFSYKKGCPVDDSGNGGGYMFDMRGILNPGRFHEYKTLTGRDKPVIDFLEQKTRMPEFLSNVFSVVDITIEDYIQRGFENLSISFGCTGGQHRSVYAADAMARHLKNKYGVKVKLCHVVQEAKNWCNT